MFIPLLVLGMSPIVVVVCVGIEIVGVVGFVVVVVVCVGIVVVGVVVVVGWVVVVVG